MFANKNWSYKTAKWKSWQCYYFLYRKFSTRDRTLMLNKVPAREERLCLLLQLWDLQFCGFILEKFEITWERKILYENWKINIQMYKPKNDIQNAWKSHRGPSGWSSPCKINTILLMMRARTKAIQLVIF